MNNILIAGLVVVGLSTVLCIVATAIPYWINYGEGGTESNVGLWRICTDGVSICVDISDVIGVSSALKATRAMMILSALTLAASTACAVLFAICIKDKPLLGTVGGALAFFGGGFSLLGVIIFAAKKDDLFGSEFDLHAGFALAIATAVYGLVAGALLVKSRSGQVGF